MKTGVSNFDYEDKVWGTPQIKPSPFYIQGLKLIYTFKDIEKATGKLVDIGCGGGNMAKAIKRERQDLNVFGIDISKKAIKEAKKDTQGVKFRVGSIEKLPVKSFSIDITVIYDVLEHIVKVEKGLCELKRVLKKGGFMHVFSPLDRQPGTLYYLLYKIGYQPKNEHTGHVQVFTDRSFTRLMEKHGFKLIRRRFSFHFLFSLFDIAYFTLLFITGKKAATSIEGMIEADNKNPFTQLFNLFYRLVVFIGFMESRVLKDVPGGGGHYLFVKI